MSQVFILCIGIYILITMLSYLVFQHYWIPFMILVSLPILIGFLKSIIVKEKRNRTKEKKE